MPYTTKRCLILALAACAAPAMAQPWNERDPRVATQAGAEPAARVSVETFRAADALPLLGKGRIVVTAPAVAPADTDERTPVYEAAVIDRLGANGYDIADAAHPDQTVEVVVSRAVVVPQEAPHRPVSGAAEVGASNRGSIFGLALAIDLSKPAKAIVATRIDVRIREVGSARVLWEGHAEGQARARDGMRIDDTAEATKLAHALFQRFPAAARPVPHE